VLSSAGRTKSKQRNQKSNFFSRKNGKQVEFAKLHFQINKYNKVQWNTSPTWTCKYPAISCAAKENRLEVIDIGQVLVGWAEEPYSRV
jgi:hypothetical protein